MNKKHLAKARAARGVDEIEAKPEQVTVYASHPAFGLLHQMHATERQLYKSAMEVTALRETMDGLIEVNKKLINANRKLGAKLRLKNKGRKKNHK